MFLRMRLLSDNKYTSQNRLLGQFFPPFARRQNAIAPRLGSHLLIKPCSFPSPFFRLMCPFHFSNPFLLFILCWHHITTGYYKHFSDIIITIIFLFAWIITTLVPVMDCQHKKFFIISFTSFLIIDDSHSMSSK